MVAMISNEVPEMIPIREVSARSGLSYDCLRKWCLQGKIIYVRIGNGKFLINWNRFVEFLNTSHGGDQE